MGATSSLPEVPAKQLKTLLSVTHCENTGWQTEVHLHERGRGLVLLPWQWPLSLLNAAWPWPV